VPWFRESHFNCPSYACAIKEKNIPPVPVGANSIVWGGAVPDPQAKRLYGWQYDPAHIILNFNRAGAESLCLNGFPPPQAFRMWMESTLACGRNGNGRVGGDYFSLGINLRKAWGTGVSSEAQGGSSGTLFGSYPHSAVGQTGLGNNTTDLFAPGPDGPVTTIRFENAREGNEEAEARVFIEKALLAKKLPAELAKRCQDLLDERANVLRINGARHRALGLLDWQDKSRRLFRLAAEAAKAAGK
jgi:hypothetical protein